MQDLFKILKISKIFWKKVLHNQSTSAIVYSSYDKGDKKMKANMKIARFASVLDRLDQHGVKVAGLIMSHAGFGKTYQNGTCR